MAIFTLDSIDCAVRIESSLWTSNVWCSIPILDSTFDMWNSTIAHTNSSTQSQSKWCICAIPFLELFSVFRNFCSGLATQLLCWSWAHGNEISQIRESVSRRKSQLLVSFIFYVVWSNGMEGISTPTWENWFVGHQPNGCIKRNSTTIHEILGSCSTIRQQCVSLWKRQICKFDKQFIHWHPFIFVDCSKATTAIEKKALASPANTTDEKNKKKKRTTILIPIVKAFGATFLFGSILEVIELSLTFVSPQLLRQVIKFVDSAKNGTTESSDAKTGIEYSPMWHGIVYAVLLFAVASVKTLCAAQYNKCMIFVGVRIRTVIKILNLLPHLIVANWIDYFDWIAGVDW